MSFITTKEKCGAKMENENNTQKKKKEGIPVFCERIKTLALESGECKTHQEFADRVNAAYGKTHLDRSYINKMIAGENDNPNAVTLASIAKAFDVSVDWLLGLTDNPARTNSDIAIASDTTGLSVEAVKQLEKMKQSPNGFEKVAIDFINYALTDPIGKSGNIFQLLYNAIFAHYIEAYNPDGLDSPESIETAPAIKYIGFKYPNEAIHEQQTAALWSAYNVQEIETWIKYNCDMLMVRRLAEEKKKAKSNTSTKQTKEGRKKK